MEIKLNNPFIKAILQLILIIATFHICIFFFFEKPNQFNLNKAEEPIKQEIYKIVDTCGAGYPVFWFVMQTDKMKNNFMIKGIFEKESFCKGSLEECNKRYAGIFKLDSKTKSFLDNIESGQVLYYEDPRMLPKYESIQSVLTLSARPINKIGIVLVKNIKDNIIYLFSITNTTTNSNCNKEKMINHLKRLGAIARSNV